MKKIIDFKRYDTETAEEITEWSNGWPRNDMKYAHEILYLTKKGNYFLYGTGGAMSRYAEACEGNMWGSGEEIIPFTEERVKKWLMETENDEALELLFPELLEDA